MLSYVGNYSQIALRYREMPGKQDLELWLRLEDPAEARRFIDEYDWNLPEDMTPDRIMLNSGKMVLFSEMTDEDAVLAAIAILRDVEVPMVMKTKQLEKWEH